MKTYKITYESATDFLKWEVIVEAENVLEAQEKGSEKGKVLCTEEIL